ncbi:MAG: hypothetical protein NTY62_01480, partial [Euryarchaeota archaeon]|nr:hypothetical protein [Euryarchaeota archaeon]
MLDKLIKEALESGCDFEAHLAPKICVIGCGGGGSNSVHRLGRLELDGVDTIAINSDSFHLARINADKRLLIGEHLAHGYGTGGDPVLGEKMARDDIDKIDALVRDYDIVFITAGMGGGTGTGTAPVVAETAKNHGAVVVSLVTLPFDIEQGVVERFQHHFFRIFALAVQDGRCSAMNHHGPEVREVQVDHA